MGSIIADYNTRATSQSDIFLIHNSHGRIKEEFSKRFQEACYDYWGKKPNQIEMARTLGVSQATVSDWWNAIKMPGLEKLIEVCIILNVCVEWLGTGRGPKTPPCVPENIPVLSPEQKEMLKKIKDLLCE